jgi:hypothetical protein
MLKTGGDQIIRVGTVREKAAAAKFQGKKKTKQKNKTRANEWIVFLIEHAPLVRVFFLLLLLSTNQNKRRRDGKGSIYNTKIRFHG